MLPDLSGIEKHPDAVNGRIMSPTQMPPATLDLSALNGNANLSSHMLELSTLVWKIQNKNRVITNTSSCTVCFQILIVSDRPSKKTCFRAIWFYIMTWKPSQTLTRKCRRLLPSFNFPNYTDNCERQAMSWDETHVKVFKKILVGLITVRCTPKSLIALILSVASIHFVYLLFKMHKHTHTPFSLMNSIRVLAWLFV